MMVDEIKEPYPDACPDYKKDMFKKLTTPGPLCDEEDIRDQPYCKKRPTNLQREPKTVLISFKSGHYKKVKGWWKGDSVWCHFHKASGGMLHVNKDEIEYMEDVND